MDSPPRRRWMTIPNQHQKLASRNAGCPLPPDSGRRSRLYLDPRLIQNGSRGSVVGCRMWGHHCCARTWASRGLRHGRQHFAGRPVPAPIGPAEFPPLSGTRLCRSASPVRHCARGVPEPKRCRGCGGSWAAFHRDNDSCWRLRESEDSISNVAELLTYEGDQTGSNRICLGPTDEIGILPSDHGNRHIDFLSLTLR